MLFAKYSRPVPVCLVNISRSVFIPDVLDILVEVEIQFAFHNGPGIRIDIGRGPTANRISSVAPVLRGKLIRIHLEH